MQHLGQKVPEMFETIFTVIDKTLEFWKTDYSCIYTQALLLGNILFRGIFLAQKKKKIGNIAFTWKCP